MRRIDEEDPIEGCAVAVGMFLRIALIPWAAFVGWMIWRWFAVEKLGLTPVPYAVVGGLMEGSTLFRLSSSHNKEDKTPLTTIVVAHVIVPAIVLGIARIRLAFA